jgi:hypothetical protein
MFVACDGEDHGLLGSTALAAELKQRNAQIDGMITCDIVGNTLGVDGRRVRDYVRCFCYAARGYDSVDRQLARAAADAARRYLPDFAVKLILRGDRFGRGGDHAPFMREGYPAVRFTEPFEDWSRQHQNLTERNGKPYGDVPEFVDFDYVAQVARLNLALLAELASAPRVPENVRARGAQDAYDTIVTLRPPTADGVPVVAFELVWRETTAADWQGSKLYPIDRNERGFLAKLPGVLLDDCVVGVRSVSAGGHRSRVAIPPEPDALRFR